MEAHSYMRKPRNQDPAPKFVGAVGNAVAILKSLAQLGEPAGVAAIARDTGVSVSTCFNILRTLASERLVAFDPVEKTYQIGLGVLELSVPLLGANQADLIRPELERLANDRNCLICLWHITENERLVLVDRVSTTRTVRVDMSFGSRLPAYVGAVGRCYAAHKNIGRSKLAKRFSELVWQNPPSFEQYLSEVEKAARDGFAYDFGQLFIGLEIAAALVTDASGKARFGISGIAISGQMPKRAFEGLASDLRDTSDWISETLFGISRGVRQSQRKSLTSRPNGEARERIA
jgi:DNA-binding IclR family transcriptional regulator